MKPRRHLRLLNVPPGRKAGRVPPTAVVMAVHNGSEVASTFPGSDVRIPVNLPPLKV